MFFVWFDGDQKYILAGRPVLREGEQHLRNMENLTGNLRTIDRLELEHLQQVFTFFEEGSVADEDLPPPVHTREMKELNFKDTKVLDFWLKGGQEVEFQSENLTLVGIESQPSGRGKTAFPGYQDYFEQGFWAS